MTTVAAEFTEAGASTNLLMRHGESFDYSVSGTFEGTVLLEISRNGGASWETVRSTVDAGISGRIVFESPDQGMAVYRFRALADLLSGTAVTSLATVAPVLQTIKNSEGAVVAQITGDGMSVTGGLTVTGAIDIDTVLTNDSGAGAKNGATVSVVEYGDGVTHKTVLTCTATPITILDDADVAQYGGVKVYDFPAGLINVLGVVVGGNLTLPAPFVDTFGGAVALGTITATTGNTLTSTEANILQSVALATAVAKVAAVDAVSAATALTESGGRHLDGTNGAIDAFLNFVINDNVAHTAETGLFTGTITITWVNEGDN